LSAFLAFNKRGPTADDADEPVSAIAAYDERFAPVAGMSALAAFTAAALRKRHGSRAPSSPNVRRRSQPADSISGCPHERA
jgi:hypothetical protein